MNYSYYAVTDPDGFVDSYGRFPSGANMNFELGDPSWKAHFVTENEFNLIVESFDNSKAVIKSKEGFAVIDPTIVESWDYIKFRECEVDGAKLSLNENGFSALVVDGINWMSTSQQVVLELYSQYLEARGRVLIGGLGMGIITLLAAAKPEVEEVVVVERDWRVIELFKQQRFDLSKITIIHDDLHNHIGEYDVALLDHYNDSSDLDEFIAGEYEIISKNIKADTYNFYLWETVGECRCYEEFLEYAERYQAKVWTFEEWQYFTSNKKCYIEPPEDLMAAIGRVNDGVKPAGNLNKDSLVEMFEDAEKQIREDDRFYIGDVSELKRDYGMYRLGDMDYLAVGVSWIEDGDKYSAKFQGGKLTDLYIIYDGGDYYSSQIDPETKKPIAHYTQEGHNKIDPETGETIQINTPVSRIFDIPPEGVSDLLNVGFPFIDSIFYYAEKPYGRTVEFSVAELL